MNRIKELRLKKGLSQDELAKKIGVSNQVISFYENGKRKPKEETWKKLAKYLDVSIPYLKGANRYSAYTIYSMLNTSFYVYDELGKTIEVYLNSNNIKKPTELFKKEQLITFSKNVEKYWNNNFNFLLQKGLAHNLIEERHFVNEYTNAQLKQSLKNNIEKQRLKEKDTPISKMVADAISINMSNFLIEASRFASKEDLLKYISMIEDKLNLIKSNIKTLPDNPTPIGYDKKLNDVFKKALSNNLDFEQFLKENNK